MAGMDENCKKCCDYNGEGKPCGDLECYKLENKTVVQHHAIICEDIQELYKEKNKAYGDSFHKARKDVPNYTLGKLYDKFNRYMNLTLHPENAAFETVEDTLLDMANYCIMELAEMRRENKNEI